MHTVTVYLVVMKKPKRLSHQRVNKTMEKIWKVRIMVSSNLYRKEDQYFVYADENRNSSCVEFKLTDVIMKVRLHIAVDDKFSLVGADSRALDTFLKNIAAKKDRGSSSSSSSCTPSRHSIANTTTLATREGRHHLVVQPVQTDSHGERRSSRPRNMVIFEHC